MKSLVQSILTTTGLFVLTGFARYQDGLTRIFLRQQTGESFLSAISRNWHGPEALGLVLSHVAFGISLWLALVLILAWFLERPRHEQAPLVTRSFTPLILVVFLTILASLSLALSPQFPYGCNLVLTLAYEGAFAQVLVWSLIGVGLVRSLAHVAGPLPRIYVSGASTRRWRHAGAVAIVAVACVLFMSVTPSRFWKDGVGQGNMLKYVRMATALASSASLDIARAEGTPEKATIHGFASRLPGMAKRSAEEAMGLLGAFVGHALEGTFYMGSVEATRANRSMFRSHRGGIYYINAPGPGILLVPAYIVDRTLNRWFGWEHQIAVILFWNLLGALLVLEMVRIAGRVSQSSRAGAIAAFALALSPPLLLYTFQIYPELPAALGLLYACRKLLMEDTPTPRGVFAAAVVLAFLPWLHQKYSVTAAALGLMAAVRFLRDKKARSANIVKLGLLFAPVVVSAFSILVYTHALTGSILPDATFRAVGRTSFNPRNMPCGLLGLLFDAENGLFVYAPLYLLALVGARKFGQIQPRLYGPVLVLVLSYLAVIASFPYWPGAVSSVARYILSVAPFAVLFIVLVVRRAFSDGVLAGVALTLFAASLSMTVAFQKDIVHSYQPGLFLGRTLYSDPHQYLPNFVSEGIVGSGPAHFTKLGVIFVGVVLLVAFLSPRLRRDPALVEKEVKLYPWRAALGAMGVISFLVIAGAFLERVPSSVTKKTGPEYRVVRPLRPGSAIEIAAEGRFGFDQGSVWVPGGSSTRFLISSPQPVPTIRVALTNVPRPNQVYLTQREGVGLPVALSPSAQEVVLLPLRNPYVFRGPDGRRFIYSLVVRSSASFVPSAEKDSQDNRNLGCNVVLR
jgi:hypothetical protein